MFPIFTLLRIVFTLAAVILLIVTVCLASGAKKKLANRAECLGTITGFQENTSAMFRNEYDGPRLSPIVSFSVGGKTYEFIGRYLDTSMKVGKQVTVLYDKDNPANASIKTGVWIAPVITGALALLFGIFAIVLNVVKNFGLI